MPFFNNIYRVHDGVMIPGTYLQAFIKNGDYYVTEIRIYKDGMIDCWGLVDLEEFKVKLAEGWVQSRLPVGARVVTMVSTLSFVVTEVHGGVSEGDFLREVLDEVERLNDRHTSLDRCRRCLDKYRKDRSPDALAELRKSYEAVPTHRRRFLGDMDNKDWEYREALGLT